MNPAFVLSSAIERLSIAKLMLKNRHLFGSSIFQYGDVQTSRNLCARIIRRIRHEQSNVREAIKACAAQAYQFLIFS